MEETGIFVYTRPFNQINSANETENFLATSEMTGATPFTLDGQGYVGTPLQLGLPLAFLTQGTYVNIFSITCVNCFFARYDSTLSSTYKTSSSYTNTSVVYHIPGTATFNGIMVEDTFCLGPVNIDNATSTVTGGICADQVPLFETTSAPVDTYSSFYSGIVGLGPTSPYATIPPPLATTLK